MAICLRRLNRPLTSFSYPPSRSRITTADQRVTHSPVISLALNEPIKCNHLQNHQFSKCTKFVKSRTPLRIILDDIAIWSRDIPDYEAMKFNTHFKAPKSDLLRFEKESILLTAECKAHKEDEENTSSHPGRPDEAKLQHVYSVLAKDLPRFFTTQMNYKIYNNNVVFENNIQNIKTVGINAYAMHMSKIKIIGHFKFAYVNMDILKITSHPEDGTIRVRWRVKGVSGLKVFFSFWKFRLFDSKQNAEQSVQWHDGFSTFYVGEDGLIFKHVADKMMPDDNETVNHIKSPLAAKVALIVGLVPGETFASSCFNMQFKTSSSVFSLKKLL